MMLGESERAWWRKVADTVVECPNCDHSDAVRRFITDGTTPISYYGFTYARCPVCRDTLLFDLDQMRLDKWGEGRKPPLLMVGVGRCVDILLGIFALYLMFSGRMLLLPLIFVIALAIEIAWELIIKRENPDWYHTDLAFEVATGIMGRIGLPMMLVRYAVAIIAVIVFVR